MGIVLKFVFGEETARVVACRRCRTHITEPEQTISRDFQGQHGRAHLYADAANVLHGPAHARTMTTGAHVVADVHCVECGAKLGWRYLHAAEPGQRYKVGHCVLERAQVLDVDVSASIV